MNFFHLLAALAERFLLEEGPPRVAALRASLEAEGVRPTHLLPHLCDEALAFAVQKDVWRAAAFEELYVRRYQDRLARWLFQWRVRPEDAQDLLQDLYRAALENRLSCYDGRSFAAYVFMTARNRTIDFCRKKRLPVAIGADADLTPGREEPPDRVAQSAEEEARIDAAIGRLEPQMGQLIRLGLLGRFSAEDAARLLGLTTNEVYRLRFRARRCLEQELRLPPQTREYARREDKAEDAEDNPLIAR